MCGNYVGSAYVYELLNIYHFILRKRLHGAIIARHCGVVLYTRRKRNTHSFSIAVSSGSTYTQLFSLSTYAHMKTP